MKAFTLFLVRLLTGSYLVAFAGMKVLDVDGAISLSDRLYFGYFSTALLQHGLAALGAVLGIFVILGFLRAFSYSVQALVFLLASAAFGYSLIGPMVDAGTVETALAFEAATYLIPMLALLVLALVPLVFWSNDWLSLDTFVSSRVTGLAKEKADKAALAAVPAAAAVAVAAVEEASASDEIAHEEPAAEAPAHDDHGHAEPAHAAPVHEEPVHEEAAHEEPAHAETEHAAHAEEAEVVAHVEEGHETPAAAEAAHDDHGHDEHVVEHEAPAADAHAEETHAEEVHDDGHAPHVDHAVAAAHGDHAEPHHVH